MIGRITAGFLSWYIRVFPSHRGMFRVVRLLARLCPGLPIQSKYGVLLSCRPKDMTFLFAALGRYGEVYPFLRDQLGPGMCFIDVGANQGVFTLVGSKAVGTEGRVLSFEPSRREFRDLLKNLEINQADNVLPFFCGLSDASGTGSLDVAADEHTGTSHYSDKKGQLSLQVDLREWEALIQALISGRKTWVKIDVEGYEERVLQSLEGVLKSRQTLGVVMEIDEQLLSAQGASAARIYEVMQQHGYHPRYGIGRSGHYDEFFLRADA